MTVQMSWEKAREQGLDEGIRKGRKEGLKEGRMEGRTEQAAKSVLTVLQARGLRVPKAVRERILAQKDPERLKRWLQRAIIVRSAAEVLDEPS